MDVNEDACTMRWPWASGGAPLEHLAEALEGVELLQLELAVDAADEDVGDVVDLVLEAELGGVAVAGLPRPGVAHDVDDRARRVDQLVVLVGEQRVGKVVVAVLLLLLRRRLRLVGAQLRGEAVAGGLVEHDGLIPAAAAAAVFVAAVALLLAGAVVCCFLLLPHDGVDLVVDGGDEQLLVAEDAEDEEARLEGAGLDAHRRGLGLDYRHDGRHHLLQEPRRLALHLSCYTLASLACNCNM
jgi:hypothetical protein